MSTQIERIMQVLERLKDPLLDEASKPTAPLDPNSPLNDLVREINKEMPLRHGELIGYIDLFHIIYGRALRDVFWLGCLLEQKRLRNIFPRDWYFTVEETLKLCFQIGKEYAPERERKSKS